MKELTSFEGVKCANCGTSLEGEYCHHCGQSVHSVLRPVHGLLEEFFETVLHVDGRILHTLPALLLRPGYLTLEYFSGRRVRYIAPFRLMFVLCVLAFFTMHLATDMISSRVAQRHQQELITGASGNFDDDENADAVREDLAGKLASLEAVRAANAKPGGDPAIVAQIQRGEQQYRDDASARLRDLGAPATAATAAAASSAAAPASDDDDDKSQDWKVSPVSIRWLPDFANQRLTTLDQHMIDNMHEVFHGTEAQRTQARERLITNLFSELPETMLALMPCFALLLALFYLFRRRLYMEHLIVSLHSHAFIFLSLMLITLLGLLSTWLRPHAAWTGWLVGVPQTVLILWLPLYLLLMQKRVYRQGWLLTIVKFWLIGWCYFWLLGLTLGVATVLGLAH